MGGGYRYVLGAMLATALLYAALSLLPVICGTQGAAGPRGGGAKTLSTTSVSAAPPAVSAAGTAASPAVAAAQPPSYTFVSERETGSSDVTWLYTREPVILRVEPAGKPHIATCLTRAPLTILRGTRLWPLETRGEWVLVRSPSRLLGWVNQRDLVTHPGNARRSY